jgi:hypothetical protein
MNTENPFEKRLERLPQRPVPPAWRHEILSAVREVAPPQQVAVFGNLLISRLNSIVTALLWPHPRAWAGLAAVWVLVFGLSFATREPSEAGFAQQSAPTSPQMRELLRQQERLLAELVGPNGTSENNLPTPAAPRSQLGRRENLVNT